MKENPYLAFLLFLMAVALPACEQVSDKEADYWYRIENTASSTVEVVVEIKQNPSVNIVGDPKRYYTLAPGETAEVWATSGFATDEVYDEEQGNPELYWIKVSAESNGRSARGNLNRPSRWKYDKHSRFKATYTLTLDENTF
ncbi:hypothetical protein [uncultured Pontibacter sp.]|uniref:hypothetical protein n=1 Tax=uncultured Pontibacter sp. TaxID=453356 RepID=UPI002633D145|nr:hypothetical protein [uncultured Pontibacter sp.]